MISPRHITAVLVLYRVTPEQSKCFLSLQEAFVDSRRAGDFALLIYDNSPERSSSCGNSSAPLLYRHDPDNGGVAAAYNAGLEEARANGSTWLLLLDQDTAITSGYLEELCQCTSMVGPEVSAIVPRLVEDGETHSPQSLPRLAHYALPETLTGLLPDRVSAFNSGAALRVSAVQRFPDRYWLDFLDHAIFHELQATGGRVWLMRARLEHQLSTQRLGEDASRERYLNVLQAERDFYKEYGSAGDTVFYHLRRLRQAAGQLWKVRDKNFALLSVRAAFGLLPPTLQRPGTKKLPLRR